MKLNVSVIINWFKKYELPFHIFNWIMPAVVPTIAVCIFYFVICKIGSNPSKTNYVNILMNFTCQLFYFSFLLLINNIALYYFNTEEKQKNKNNQFSLSIFVAIIILLLYIAGTIITLVNCNNCGIKTTVIAFMLSFTATCVSVYLYSKNSNASFILKDNESAKISEERTDKSKKVEERIMATEE